MRKLLATNDAFECQLNYEDYKEFCDINGMEPMPEYSGDFYEWLHDTCDNDFNEFLDFLEYVKGYDVPVLFSGHVQKWDGKHNIYCQFRKCIHDAVVDCVISSDYNDVSIYHDDEDKGKLVIECTHHDGTNVFVIEALSRKGIRKAEGHLRLRKDFGQSDFKKLSNPYESK